MPLQNLRRCTHNVVIRYYQKTFEVAKGANKIEIKKAVEEVFGVEVEKVTTMNYIGKPKRQGVFQGKRADWKKAVVKLKEGSKTIELFEG